MKINYGPFMKRMKDLRVNQTHLAEISGYTKGSISIWLNSGTPMPGSAIAKIAESLRMEPDEVYVELLGLKTSTRELSADEVVSALRDLLLTDRSERRFS